MKVNQEDEDIERVLEEEQPGPPELDSSALLRDSLKAVEASRPVVVDEGAMLDDAIRLMRESDQRCVLVTREGVLCGIFTEHDAFAKILDSGIDLGATPVVRYMTADPAFLPEDAVVAFALNKMVVDGFHRLPLVDSQGRPTGVVSMRNIVGYLTSFFLRDVLDLPPDPSRIFREREGA